MQFALEFRVEEMAVSWFRRIRRHFYLAVHSESSEFLLLDEIRGKEISGKADNEEETKEKLYTPEFDGKNCQSIEDTGTTRRTKHKTWLQRLFSKNDDDEQSKDPEAGIEFLDKVGSTKSGVEVEPPDKAASQGSLKGEPAAQFLGFPRGRVTLIGIGIISLLLVVVVVFSILTSGTVKRRTMFQYAVTTTTCGLVQGLVEDDALVFRGIPYALPPVGERRWKPSEAPSRAEDCWKDVYLAHNHSKLCYQKPIPYPYGSLEFSEDCLYLDIYTPRLTYEEPMSVVVYFAGDSFQGHDVMDFKWRPSAKLALEKNVVFVVVYYRMNAFGFLALKLLTKNAHPPTSGNYGLHDMLTALRWVRDNIESFGGNPSKVTLFGHGSGATGILALMSSSMGQMLFTQAWITSGSANFVNKTLQEVERNNEAFNRHLMCDTTECLYNKTAEQVLSAIPTSEWPFWGVPNHFELPTIDEHTASIAVVDGAILYDNPRVAWEENSFADVSLVIGSSFDDIGSRLMEDDFENFDWKTFNATVRTNLGTFGASVADQAIELYYSANSSALERYIRMVSDLRVTCPLLDLAYRASKAFSNNVYFYVASHVPDGIAEYVNLSNKMAFHGLDVAAVFGCIPQVLINPTERDLAFQDNVQEMFYNFVERGRLSTLNANPKMPWHINWIYEQLESSKEPLPNCEFWTGAGIYPKYARMN